MAISRVAFRYANPIIEMAEEKGVLDKIRDDIKGFLEVCRENRGLKLMLNSPIIPHLKKADILSKIFKGKVEELTLKALYLIARKNRENLLEEIAEEFLNLYNIRRGIQAARVTSSTDLTESQRKEFGKIVEQISKKEALITESVDDELIGGYILKIGDKQIDQSVSGQLKSIKLNFKHTSSKS